MKPQQPEWTTWVSASTLGLERNLRTWGRGAYPYGAGEKQRARPPGGGGLTTPLGTQDWLGGKPPAGGQEQPQVGNYPEHHQRGFRVHRAQRHCLTRRGAQDPRSSGTSAPGVRTRGHGGAPCAPAKTREYGDGVSPGNTH